MLQLNREGFLEGCVMKRLSKVITKRVLTNPIIFGTRAL